LERMLASRKKTDEMLQFTKFTIDRAVDPAFWISPEAKILYVNDAACTKLNYSQKELLNLTVHDIDPKFPKRAWKRHWEEIKGKGSFTVESQHRTKDGNIFPVEVAWNFLEYKGKEYNCVFARDITERKDAEQVLADQAIRDPLTNLYNRRYFNSLGERKK